MQKKINVAILGSGYGLYSHLPIFKLNENVKIYAFYTRSKKKSNLIKKKYKTVKIYNNLDKIISDDQIDLFSIALPPSLHFRVLKKIIIKKKPFLCEKPFTTNLHQAKKITEYAKKNNVDGFVGYQLRFQPVRKIIKNIIDGGELGKIINMNLSYDFSSRINLSKWDWWSDTKLGGGVLNAIGSHHIDLLKWWFGKIDEVLFLQGRISKKLLDKNNKNKNVNSDEFVHGIIKFTNKALATINISSVAIGWRNTFLKIYGTNGALFLDGEHKLTMIRKTTAQHDLSYKDNYIYEKWSGGSIWKASFKRQIDEIINILLKKKKFYEGATLKDGLEVRKIIDAIKISSKKKKFIQIR